MAIRINQAGVNEVLRGDAVRAATHAAAEAVAENVRAQGITVGDLAPGTSFEIPLPVEVDTSSTDGRSFVTLAHPAGAAVQAKHGALSKAAARAGLTLRSQA